MSKNFDDWNAQKKLLDAIMPIETNAEGNKIPRFLFSEWEIRWCKIGQNIGREVYGKWMEFTRPVYILKKISMDMCIVIPVSSQLKTGTWFHTIETVLGTQTLILPQVRLISANRFGKKLIVLLKNEQEEIKQKFLEFFQ